MSIDMQGARRFVNLVRAVARPALPPKLYRLVHVVYHSARRHYQRVVFWKAMRDFLAKPSACAEPGNPVLQALVYGWGNDEWTASDEYLAACLQHALNATGPILECGSGLSTLLVGAVAKEVGRQYWALEHMQWCAARTQSYLDRYALDSVAVRASPLREYDGFDWYDPPLAEMPSDFTLVLCDGPPGTTRGGRHGLIPVMRDRLAPRCTILLDDAARGPESAIARRWQLQLGATLSIHGSRRAYVEITLPN